MTATTIAIKVTVESLKNAEKNGCAKAYLARLSLGPRGSVERSFAPKLKLGGANRRAFQTIGRPGEVFEARRWQWDGSRYIGGSVWFGLQADGSLFPLTRAEALGALHAPRIEDATGDVPMIGGERPSRITLFGVFVRLADASAQSPPLRIEDVL